MPRRTVREALRAVGRRSGYGEGPLHLLVLVASFALTAYAGLRLLSTERWALVVVWFAGAALLHDLVLLPLYSLADRALRAVTAGGGRHRDRAAYVRVPAVLSGLPLLVWFPLIAGASDVPGGGGAAHYTATTGLPGDVFLGRWLLLTAALFAASALVWTLRAVQPRLRGAVRRRSATKRRPAAGRH